MSVNRRAVLALGAGAALAVAVPTTAQASTITGKLRDLEKQHGARLGVFATDTGTGRTVLHRADERLPDVFDLQDARGGEPILRRDRDGELLSKVITYTQAEVDKSGYGPITGKPENLANGMTVSALCEATITYSDNAAANLLLRELGGPSAVTRFCRSIGDPVTRLDRWEPELNSAEPWRECDTTSPRAVGQSYARLTVGHALDRADAEQLTAWLLANTTGANRSEGRVAEGLAARGQDRHRQVRDHQRRRHHVAARPRADRGRRADHQAGRRGGRRRTARRSGGGDRGRHAQLIQMGPRVRVRVLG